MKRTCPRCKVEKHSQTFQENGRRHYHCRKCRNKRKRKPSKMHDRTCFSCSATFKGVTAIYCKTCRDAPNRASTTVGYEPTPEEIREQCLTFQRDWEASGIHRRNAYDYTPPVETPCYGGDLNAPLEVRIA